MKSIVSIVSVMVITIALMAFNLVSCSGGGGGGVEGDVEQPPPGGTASGADNIPVFWLYQSNGWGESTSVQETADNGFIVAGSRPNASDTGQETFLAKTNSLGVVSWEKILNGPNEKINSIRQTTDGGYIFAERIDTCEQSKTCLSLVRTDATGTVLWRNAEATSSLGWPGPGGGAYAARQTFSNNVADGFVMVGSGADQNVAIIKTDLSGITSWVRSLPTPSNNGWEVGYDVEQTADGGFIIAGVYDGAELGIFKTDKDGVLQWPAHFGSGEAFGVRQTYTNGIADGYVLAGRTTVRMFGDHGPADAIIIKTDLNGKEVWRRSFGGAEDDEAHSVALSQDGGYVLTGTTRSFGGTVTPSESYLWDDIYLIKLDRDGNTVWQKVKGVRPPGNDHGNEIAAVSDGGFIVAGASGANAMFAKFDKNGDTVNLGDTDLTLTVPAVSGIIKFTNAVEVAAAGVIGIKDPHDVGANSLDLLIAKLGGAVVSDYCSSGSYSFSPDPPSGAPASSFVLTFNNCVSVPAASQTLNGSATVTIDSVSGNLTTDAYSIQVTLSSLNLAIAEAGGALSSTITGGMRFSRTATSGDFAEISQSIDGTTKLTLSETEGTTARIRALGPFSLHDSVGKTGSYSYGAVNDTFTVMTTSPSVGTAVSFAGTVLAPIQGAGLGAAPESGSFRIIAMDNSGLTATITNGTAAIAVDTNGDSTDDGTMSSGWDSLN